MAKQNGIFQIEGTLQGMTFYKSKDGHLVRTKGGVSKSRIDTDPAFARTKENGTEFGSSASSGKLLRNAFRNFVTKAADGRVTSRVTKVMTQIKNLHTSSVRGMRNVAVGISTSAGRQLLKGFNFNKNSVLSGVIHVPIAADAALAKVIITGVVPKNDISVPPSATHFSIVAAFGAIDFASGATEVEYTNVYNGAIDLTSVNITLQAAVPKSTALKVVLLMVEFFQEINGAQYTLNNGSYNALAVIDVV